MFVTISESTTSQMSLPNPFPRRRDGSSSGHGYSDVHISGDAKAHLGDSYNFRVPPFHVLIETEHLLGD
jgi:hypothetical protein